MPSLLFIDDHIMDVPREVLNAADYVLNFSSRAANTAKLIQKSNEYDQIRYRIKSDYTRFIYELGSKLIKGKTIKQHFRVDSYSLWWFSEIHHKDTFNDSFFDDLCKAYFLHVIKNEYDIDHFVILSNSKLLQYLFRQKKTFDCRKIVKLLFSRVKAFLELFWNKVTLSFSHKSIQGKIGRKILFFSHDINWIKIGDSNRSDRFFRALPDNVPNGSFLIKLTKLRTKLPYEFGPHIVLDRYFKLTNLLQNFLNPKYVLKYIYLRREFLKHCYINGIDCRPVFDEYMWCTVLTNDFYYISLINALRILNRKEAIKRFVTYGEFGLPVRAIVVAAAEAGIPTTWMQHGVGLDWELYYMYEPSEIKDHNGKINTNFVEYLPVSDEYLVWGTWFKNILLKSGYPEDRIHITGNHNYDHLKKVRALIDDSKTNSDKKTRCILICPSSDIVQTIMLARIAILVKGRYPRDSVTLKLHPRMFYGRRIRAFVSKTLNSRVRVKGDDIANYYYDSDVIITSGSTVSVEFAYLGKCVLSLTMPYSNRFSPPWANEDCSTSDVETLLNRIGENDCGGINYANYFIEPGNSTEAIIKHLNPNR